MKFFDFVGNQRVKTQIASQIDNGRLHNTIIIEGEAGSQKNRLADIIAMAAVCKGEGEKPCTKCSGCIKAIAGSHPDILRFYPQDGRVKINSDETRTIRSKAFVMPNEAERNIIIIGDAGKMEDKTQNMLLKVLEETPDRTTFILLCESKENLLETVRSRGTILSLGGVGTEEAAKFALKECPDASFDDALLCAEIANGLVGETVALLKDKKLKENIELTARIIDNGISGRYDALVADVLSLDKDKSRFNTVLKTTLIVCRDALLISAGVDVAPINKISNQLAVRLSEKQLQSIYDSTADIIKKSEQSANAKLLRTRYIMLLKNKGDE